MVQGAGCRDAEEDDTRGPLTHVIQVPCSLPKAICHAGSRDWKNSSGWKKVRRVKALRMRKAIRKRRMLVVAEVEKADDEGATRRAGVLAGGILCHEG